MTDEERVRYGIRHGMVQMPWEDASEVGKVCEWAMAQGVAPVSGWTKGLHWVVYGSSANIRIYLGTKRFTAFIVGDDDHGYEDGKIWVDPDFYPTLALFIGEIKKDIAVQIARLKNCGQEIGEFVSAHKGLRAETFPKWSSSISAEARQDPLHKILYERYQQEYETNAADYRATMRRVFLSHARTRGARYISVESTLFCVLEDVRTDGAAGPPVAHQIMEDLNLFAGGYDSFGAKTMNLMSLGRDIEGIWFVDTDEPVKVHGMPLNLNMIDQREIMMGQGDRSLTEWLEACGARKRKPFGA